MKLYKRIISCFMILAIVFSCCAMPVWAEDDDDDDDDDGSGRTFWDLLYEVGGNLVDGTVGSANMLANTVRSWVDDDICPQNPSYGGHHEFEKKQTQVNGQFGEYWICKYCHKSAGEVAKEQYNEHINDLPGTVIFDDSSFEWWPDWSDGGSIRNNDFTVGENIEHVPHAVWFRGYLISAQQCTYGDFVVEFPWSGWYETVPVAYSSFYYLDYHGTRYNVSQQFSQEKYHYTAKAEKRYSNPIPNAAGGCYCYGYIHFPKFRVWLDETLSNVTNNIYNIDYRPSIYSGDIYYIDNSNNWQVTNNVNIINEDDKTFTDPATGITYHYESWSYDYSTRTYTFVNESGDTTTITYGDTSIIVNNGGNTYYYYYFYGGNGDDPNNPDNPSCVHQYSRSVTREPSCTISGVETYTCSKCGYSYTKNIPSLGHDWQVAEVVEDVVEEEPAGEDEESENENGEDSAGEANTGEDDTGQNDSSGEGAVKQPVKRVTQRGYTLYRCSRCGAEQKSYDGTPPDSGGGTSSGGSLWDKIGEFFGVIGGGIIDIISTALGKILDSLIALAEMIMDKLAKVVETIMGMFDELPQMFEGFLSFLSAIFPFLPPELMTILTFGIACVVFIGIIKAIRR